MKAILFLSTFIFLNACEAKENMKAIEASISKEQAIKIAEEKLVEVYGKQVLKERPFSASLDNNTWNISGTMHCPKGDLCAGGVAHISISAKGGKVLNFTHDK